MKEPLIQASNLVKTFQKKKISGIEGHDRFYAVNHVSFTIAKGESVGLIGESGCGKTTVGKVLLHLLSPEGGRVMFQEHCLFDREKGRSISQMEWVKYRQQMQMIFQNPASCLNPRRNILQLVLEGVKKHHICEKSDQESYCREVLAQCGLSGQSLYSYPSELSGGQKQRVGIARALAVNPSFIVCDEITASLDVSVQAQILNLLLEIKEKRGLSVLFITHNLDLVPGMCDRVLIMYRGRIVEEAPAKTIATLASHPYTRLLLASLPAAYPEDRGLQTQRITEETDIASACPFAPRCPHAHAICRDRMPLMKEREPGHFVACHFMNEIGS